jgi:hypothetical protein
MTDRIDDLNQLHPKEIWKDIEGYEDYYQVSNIGDDISGKATNTRNKK